MSELTDNEFNSMLSGFNKQTGIEKTFTQAEFQQEKMKLIQWIYDCDYLNEDGVRAFETMPELKQRINQEGVK